jgi:hypothetical protein
MVGSEVLTPVVMKSANFWDITPCSLLKVTGPRTCFHAGILLDLFDPEDRDDMFLRNVGWLSTDYTSLYPRRYYSIHKFIVYVYIATKACVRFTQRFTMKSTVFWGMTPCGPVEIHRHLILSNELLHEHGIKSQQAILLMSVLLMT